MGSVSKTSSMCRICHYKDKCDSKTLESCAFVEVEKQNSAPCSQKNTVANTAPVLRKHQYRDIYLDKDTSVTVDLLEIKEKLRKDFYMELGIGFYSGA